MAIKAKFFLKESRGSKSLYRISQSSNRYKYHAFAIGLESSIAINNEILFPRHFLKYLIVSKILLPFPKPAGHRIELSLSGQA